MGFYPPAVSIPVETKPEHPSARADDDLGDGDGVELPAARLLDPEPTDTQVKWTLRIVWFMLVALVLVCAIGPHIPAGE